MDRGPSRRRDALVRIILDRRNSISPAYATEHGAMPRGLLLQPDPPLSQGGEILAHPLRVRYVVLRCVMRAVGRAERGDGLVDERRFAPCFVQDRADIPSAQVVRTRRALELPVRNVGGELATGNPD